MNLFSKPTWGGTARAAAVARIMSRHAMSGLAEALFGRFCRTADAAIPASLMSIAPRHLREALQELGPSFIKLGQLLSTRADILPKPFIDELSLLQDQVPAIPFTEVRVIIESELGPIESLFRSFEPQAMAAASVAQVHRAVSLEGMSLAVKIVRPGIRKIIQKDIRLMYRMAGRLESLFEAARLVGVVHIVEEFERTVFRELDMFIEAGNMERFAENFRDIDEIHIPKVHWDMTSRSVLVMEFIEGVRMDQIAAIRGMGIDPEEIALIGLRSFSRQMMVHGYYHADPHPGNTIVMPDGRVGLVDFGIVGYLDPVLMKTVGMLFLGFAEHDYEMVIDALIRAGILSEAQANHPKFVSDFMDACEPFYGRSLRTITARDVYDQIMQLVLRHRIRLPRNILLILKTIVQTEALGKILGSHASLLEQAKPFARRLVRKGLDATALSRNLSRDIRDAYGHTRDIPKWVNRILKHAAEDDGRIHLHHSGLEALQKGLEKG
ncbi:MAG: AarF/ABC1/UbiB kinase family protein, partial [Thermodesulfobacteriota bacterium]